MHVSLQVTFRHGTGHAATCDVTARKSAPSRSGGSKRIRRGSASKGASKSGSRADAETRVKGNARSGSRGRVKTGVRTPLERELRIEEIR
jgi:hypothetical protein